MGTEPGGRQRHRPPGVGVVLLADLDQVDGPRKSRLVGVGRIATGDEHAPSGIEPALDVVVHVLAAHDPPPPWRSAFEEEGKSYSWPLTTSGDVTERSEGRARLPWDTMAVQR
jgi:hypothetical protein